MTISTDRLAAIEAAALAGCPTLPATIVEIVQELRETRRQRDGLFAACQRLRGWARVFLMDDHPAVISVDEAIADATRGTRHHG